VAEKILDVKPSSLYVLYLRKATTGVKNTIREVISLLREGILSQWISKITYASNPTELSQHQFPLQAQTYNSSILEANHTLHL